MNFIKFQLGCLIILLYIIIVYAKQSLTLKVKCNPYFVAILVVSPFAIILDGATAYTVNHLDTIPESVNLLLHLLFFFFMNASLAMSFFYMHSLTTGTIPNQRKQSLLLLPFTLSTTLIVGLINQLYYVEGVTTNYSMGISVYVCYASVVLHFTFIVILGIVYRNVIPRRKRVGLFSILALVLLALISQIIFPEILITALMPLLLVLGYYVNFEDPFFKSLQTQNQNMIEGFATLVESRDFSTGGHINRTRVLVEQLMSEMSRHPKYSRVLTGDYKEWISEAAPLHDIGKIAIPDNILQKEGPLTDEEYAIMKLHSRKGGDIIMETFKENQNPDFLNVAYEIARYHHERWDGNGYPDGLKGEEIPLHARIMSIADVFDAVSSDRCYRVALPMDECIRIMKKGAGTQFDPELVELFLKTIDYN